MPTMTFFKSVDVPCSNKGPKCTCFGYTAYDESQKAIVMSFRGTEGSVQLMDEILDFFTGKKPFFDAGNIFTYFYDAFYFLWNGGLEAQVRTLKYRYPDYQLWVTGHSLGASIASIAASHAVKVGIFNGTNVRLVTFGQPRTGDLNYSSWHEQTFPYSYRIVHHKDPVPHVDNSLTKSAHHKKRELPDETYIIRKLVPRAVQ
ncbi:hypothetical protein WR25_08349 [Diploscapter pachys]|uniref:Fungal lipase-type domain-containing protein n=1 Tax=Diploscapter pachys TaxID=2018661 RepID=A0A2A2JVZ6_9BILA|nr:hypothetical protein WR25_08349 [Diploscapter pachys]